MVPADEGFEALQPTVTDGELRLIHEVELLPLQRAAERVGQLEALDRLGSHGRFEAGPPALAFGLRLVHGDVGLAQELLRRLGGLGEGQAYAHRQGYLTTGDLDRLSHGGHDPIRHTHGGVGRVDPLQQHREFVTAQPGDGVVPPDQ